MDPSGLKPQASSLAPILAVSSPPGGSARAIIRVSGDGLAGVIREVVDSPPPPRSLAARRLCIPPLPCLALYHPAPNSFTAQDILELQIPGNPALIERVLHSVLATLRRHDPAARFAEPGEFTQRAFMARRIDLTRAEGIAATIGARSDAQLQAAKLLRTGRLGRWAADLTDRVAQLLALVEAGIDFVDQDGVVAIAPARLDAGLAGVEGELRELLARSRSWSALEALPWVVLAGRPNAGKSTLFNALLGRERAVTSDVAGTTRDALPEPLRIATPAGEAEVMLVDVAGLDPQGPESLGFARAVQSAALDAIGRAELIIMVHDPDNGAPLPAPREGVPVIHVWSKSDVRTPGPEARGFAMSVSAVAGHNLDALRTRIAEAVRDRAVTLSGEMIALTPRHHDELTAALAAVQEARAWLAGRLDDPALPDMELIADAMRRTLDHLGAVGGRVTADDVIGRVFATFCVGK